MNEEYYKRKWAWDKIKQKVKDDFAQVIAEDKGKHPPWWHAKTLIENVAQRTVYATSREHLVRSPGMPDNYYNQCRMEMRGYWQTPKERRDIIYGYKKEK